MQPLSTNSLLNNTSTNLEIDSKDSISQMKSESSYFPLTPTRTPNTSRENLSKYSCLLNEFDVCSSFNNNVTNIIENSNLPEISNNSYQVKLYNKSDFLINSNELLNNTHDKNNRNKILSRKNEISDQRNMDLKNGKPFIEDSNYLSYQNYNIPKNNTVIPKKLPIVDSGKMKRHYQQINENDNNFTYLNDKGKNCQNDDQKSISIIDDYSHNILSTNSCKDNIDYDYENPFQSLKKIKIRNN
eukprot:jgi/Orpsp1_1/1176960/evm.model.c7180000059644.1